jgi:hypothetical protein
MVTMIGVPLWSISNITRWSLMGIKRNGLGSIFSLQVYRPVLVYAAPRKALNPALVLC